MLARLLKRNQTTNRPERTRWVIFLVIAILASALFLRFVDWTISPPRSLLTQAPGLVQLASVEDVITYSAIVSTLPTQTFNAELYVAGVYTKTNDLFPTGTVSLIYTSNKWRAFEIDYMPGRSLEEQRAILLTYPQEEVVLDDTTSATIVARNDSPRCIDYEDDLPNKCEITVQLFFMRDDILISISADGTHSTQGELIEIAKSIISSSSPVLQK